MSWDIIWRFFTFDRYSLAVLFILLLVLIAIFYNYLFRKHDALHPEQVKLHATLIGNLANIILGGGVVTVLIPTVSSWGKVPTDSDQLYTVLANAFVVIGSASMWFGLHLYAIKLLENWPDGVVKTAETPPKE